MRDTIDPSLVIRDETCVESTFRVVHYEDQKSSHIEVAILEAHLTEEEWKTTPSFTVVGVNLVGLDERQSAQAVLISNIVLTKDLPV